MKKTYTLLIGYLLGLVSLQAQNINYDKIIHTEAYVSSFEEQLVQLAWKNNPKNDAFLHQTNIAAKTVTLAKWSWTDNFRFFYNFSDITMRYWDGELPTLWQPQFGLGLSFNMGSFFNIPGRIKIARENLEIAKDNTNAQKLTIRAETLRRYHTYTTNIARLKLRTQQADDAYSSYLMLSKKFKNGEISLDEYNKISAYYNNALDGKLLLENEVVQAKIAVEEMIGVPLEEAQEAYGAQGGIHKKK